ncbi:hypothetical protein CLV78_103233 [Aliiruegeria haliotis]|uniref:Uncharacterized protein n=1 Tax=Aliiruegeria haliotis TaxID=1280846 RepID=A0A2T0RTA6_9RHOB|nr:hypothetical protein CLV78_103233 [Aliiruegeria haliotis]
MVPVGTAISNSASNPTRTPGCSGCQVAGSKVSDPPTLPGPLDRPPDSKIGEIIAEVAFDPHECHGTRAVCGAVSALPPCWNRGPANKLFPKRFEAVKQHLQRKFGADHTTAMERVHFKRLETRLLKACRQTSAVRWVQFFFETAESALVVDSTDRQAAHFQVHYFRSLRPNRDLPTNPKANRNAQLE